MRHQIGRTEKFSLRGGLRPISLTFVLAGIVALILSMASAGFWRTNAQGSDVTDEHDLNLPVGFRVSYEYPPLTPWQSGGKITFSSTRDGVQDAEIYVMNSDGSNQSRLTDIRPSHDSEPNFSTDGTRIVFKSNRDAFNDEIYVMDANGSNPARLTNNPARESEPVFSPDGTRVAFVSNRESFNPDIYIMNADGSNQTRLTTHAANDGSPDFSPDGTRIAFFSLRDGNVEIYVMNSDGTGQTRLTNNAVSDFDPRFSPDGTRIAFTSSRDGNEEIYVMNANGSNQTRLTNNSAIDTRPVFSPDGTALAFASERDGLPQVYMMDATGSNQTRLTNNSGRDTDPAWAVGTVPVPTPTPTPQARTVTKTADTNDGLCDSDCSLREAIAAAASGDTIEFASPLFDSPQTIALTPTGMGGLGGFDISRNITIVGKGANLLTVGRPAQTDHSSANRLTVMSIGSIVNANLIGMTISGAVAGASGGGISTSSVGSVTTITGCNITGNFANSTGGGIRNDSPLTIINSTISNNESASGGGIYTTTNLTLINSTLTGNKAGSGGGILHFGGTSVLSSVTMTDNEATGTTAASAIARSFGSLTIRNSIISGNRNNATKPELTGASGSTNDRYVSQGYNLIGNPGTVIDFTQTGDQTGMLTPMLGPLSPNGGTTPTHAVLAGSPALDKGSSFGVSTDQRGSPRPVNDPNIPPATGGDNSDIGSYELPGGATPTPTSTPTATPTVTPTPGPTGAKIVFQTNRDGNEEIYTMNPDGTSQTRITNNPAADGSPDVSSDGNRIVFGSDRDGNNEIYVMNIDGTNQTRLTNNSLSDGAPSFSRDGSRIVFTRFVGSNNLIYSMNADGSNQIQLTSPFQGYQLGSPRFSPDGTRIVFTSSIPAQASSIVVMNADGTNQIQLSNLGSSPSYSPDGTRIIFTRSLLNGPVWIMNADGTNQVEINNAFNNNYPSYSPDGTRLSVHRLASNNFDVHVMQADGTNVVQITSLPSHERGSRWFGGGSGTPTPTATPTATATSTPTATPTNTPTATPTPGAGFEGDIAPRPNGDGSIISTDVIQMRRFATGLDTPNPATNEAQRADSAPRSTGGDGSLNSSDVVQTRRYASGLDPMTGAGGPVPSSVMERVSIMIDDLIEYFHSRELRVGTPFGQAETQITIPVELTPNGDEAALSFTVEYDTQTLANPRVALGDLAPKDSTLTFNVNGGGRIGILIDSTESMTASAMPQRLLTVTFDVIAEVEAISPVMLTGSLAAKGVSDSSGNLLATRYVGGNIIVNNR